MPAAPLIIQLWVNDIGSTDQRKLGAPTASFRVLKQDLTLSKWYWLVASLVVALFVVVWVVTSLS